MYSVLTSKTFYILLLVKNVKNRKFTQVPWDVQKWKPSFIDLFFMLLSSFVKQGWMQKFYKRTLQALALDLASH